MRFHIGFSKRINIKTLIALLGTIFVGLLAFFGLIDHAYADNVVSGFRWCSYATDTYYQYIRFTKPSREITDGLSTTTESTFKYGCSRSDIDYAWAQFNNTKYNSLYSIQDNNYNSSYDVYKTANIGFNVSNLCSNYSDTNSIDFFIPFRSNSVNDMNSTLTTTPFSNHYGTIIEIGDIMDFTVSPIYSNYTGEERECYISSNDDDSSEYDLNCLGVPYNDEIIGYNFKMYNKYYYNFENVSNVFFLNNYNSKAFGTPIEFRKTIDYQCSYVEPQPSDNSIGESNIDFDRIEGNGASSDVSGQLNLDWYDELDIPQSITNLITLPFRLITTITGLSGTCQPIYLDFSSFTQRFGGFNYRLELPCMRAYLSRLLGQEVILGFTFYNLLDIMTAFALTIFFAKYFYGITSRIIAGEDLTDYFVEE